MIHSGAGIKNAGGACKTRRMRMIIKVDLDPDQLAALHRALGADSNTYEHRFSECQDHTSIRNFVQIMDSHARRSTGPNIATVCREPAIPKYAVTLEVAEVYWVKTVKHPVPMNKLTAILQAIGLFPTEPNVPVK